MTTQKKLSNKYFSDKQEAMIADYLGWGQISGSGSRPFAPGDVRAEHWLGECKTHNTERPTVAFIKAHWFKIREEAAAKNRYPVLFVDNGTQQAQNTWVMTPVSLFDPTTLNVIEGPKNTSTKGNSLTFDLASTNILYKHEKVDNKITVFKIHWDRDLAVMPLSTFKEFFEESF